MNLDLQRELQALADRDENKRAELVARGELFDGYHAEMAAVHAANAEALERIIARWGWPGASLVGESGANSAWLILQHAIGNPELQRRCLPLVQAAADAGEVPLRHAAFLEDRIRCFEGKPQRFGTQLDWDENGLLSPMPLEDAEGGDRRRADVGLEPLETRVNEARAEACREGAEPPENPAEWRRRREAWARSVGWR